MLTKCNVDDAHALKVLSSAKLWRIETVRKKKKSFIEILKGSGPGIEPCSTPEMIFLKELYVLFMRTHCLQNCLQDTALQVSKQLDIDIESSNPLVPDVD